IVPRRRGRGGGGRRGRLRRRCRLPRRGHPVRPRLRHPGPQRPPAPSRRAPHGRKRLSMAEITYRQALHDTLREEMVADDSVFLIGEEIGVFEGSYKITAGLLSEFGPRRVRDTPICEEGFVGVAIGAA